MSISTSSIGSYTCSSGVLQSNEIEGWKSELGNRVHVCDNTIQHYFEAFVPSSAPPLPHVPLRTPFSRFIPQSGHEVRSYKGLLAGLRKVTSRFPTTKLLTFFPNHRERLAFPFKAFEHKHHDTFPDIAVSLPGQPLSKADWKNIAAFVEVKATASDDPFLKDGDKHSLTLVQMAMDARGLLVAHGLLAAFVIGVYGDTARIVRFDHSSIVASPSVSLKQDPDILRQFFWRLVHPAAGDTIVGCDPTSRHLAPHELAWVEERLRLADKEPLQEPDRCRKIDVYAADGSLSRTYFLLQLIDINARLLSRSTTVWLALKDPRDVVDGQLSDFPDLDPEDTAPLEQVIIKDAWRQLIVHKNEKLFYDRLASTIPPDAYCGLPRILCGGDLGQTEVEQWTASGAVLEPPSNVQQPRLPVTNAHTSASRPPATPPPPPAQGLLSSPAHSSILSPVLPSTPVDQGHQAIIFGSPLTPLSDSSSYNNDTTTSISGSDLRSLASTSRDASEAPTGPQAAPFPLRYPQHQTFTWRVLVGDTHRHRERSHMRFVVDIVGRRLTRFRSTRELVLAMRDAIIGHKLAWKHAKLLHRDVSVGNILIVEDPEAHGFHGFLHDFDHSFMEDVEADSEYPSNSPGNESGPSTAPNGITDPARTADVSDINEDLKERTGTYFFMARELLEDKDALHTVEHDLQSFYWVLLWVVLRHMLHDDERGHNACQKVFVYGDDQDSASAKAGHLMAKRSVGVKENKPLSYLLDRFRELVRHHCGIRTPEQPPFTHDSILEIFNKALSMDDWPENDGALPVVLESKKTTNVNHGKAGSKSSSRKRRKENVGTSGTSGSSKRSKQSTPTGTSGSSRRQTRSRGSRRRDG